MANKEPPPGGGPELDPFGANDPAWERYEGVSGLRRLAQTRAKRHDVRPYRRPRGEMLAFMVVAAGGLALVVGGIFLVAWLLGLAFD